MNFVKVPNLPDKKVSTVIVGENYNQTIQLLLNLGIKVVKLGKNNSLQKPLQCHSDMSILHLGKEYFAISNQIKQLDINKIKIISSCNLEMFYPNDISLNIALIGNIAVVGNKNKNSNLLENLSSQNYNIIKVKQGYCKCSICIVNENAIITDDENIAKALYGFLDVLLINKGSVKLEGYDYGFIGGTCGLIDKNLLAFTGDINTHSDSLKIKSFLKKHNCNYICLSKERLVDIGGILPIKTI